MKTTTINKTKLGQLIRFSPSESAPMWIRGQYCHASKRYSLTRWNDTNRETLFHGCNLCFTGFTF